MNKVILKNSFKVFFLRKYIHIFLFASILFIVMCGSSNNTQSKIVSTVSPVEVATVAITPEVSFCDKQNVTFESLTFPNRIEVNDEVKNYCYKNMLALEFNATANKAYKVKLSNSLLSDSSSGRGINELITYADGRIILPRGVTPSVSSPANFISSINGIVSLIYYKAIDGEKTLSVSVEEYDPNVVEPTEVKNQWGQYFIDSVKRLSYNIVKGQIYTIYRSEVIKCDFCFVPNEDTGRFDILVHYGDNSIVWEDDSYFGSIFASDGNALLEGSKSFIAKQSGLLQLDIYPRSSSMSGNGYPLIGTISVKLESPANLIDLPLGKWQDYSIEGTSYFRFEIKSGSSYSIFGKEESIGYESIVLADVLYANSQYIFNDLKSFYPTTTSSIFYSDKTDYAYAVVQPNQLGLMGLKIEGGTSSAIKVNAGWQSYNISNETEFDLDVNAHVSYIINLDDKSQGSGAYSGDTKITVRRANGTSLYYQVDNAYSTDLNITLDNSEKVKIIISPNTNGIIGLNIASQTPAPIVINGGWTSHTNNTKNLLKYHRFNVTKGTIYSVQWDEISYSGACKTSGAYTGSISVMGFYAGEQNNGTSVLNDNCGYKYPKLFVAKKTGILILRVSNYNGGGYALKVDTKNPDVFNTSNNLIDMNLTNSLAYKVDVSPGKSYLFHWQSGQNFGKLYTSQPKISISYSDGTEIYFEKRFIASLYNKYIFSSKSGSIIFLVNVDGTSGTFGLKIKEIPVRDVPANGLWSYVENLGEADWYKIYASFEVSTGKYYRIFHKFRINSLIYADGSLASLPGGNTRISAFRARSNSKVYIIGEGSQYTHAPDFMNLNIAEF